MQLKRIVLLGSGLGIPDVDRGPTQLYWQSAAGHWLIDCGGETFRRLLAADVDPRMIDGLIVTHSHTDHIGGIPSFLFNAALAGRQRPLPIFGPSGALIQVRALIDAAALGDVCPPLAWSAVEPGSDICLPNGFTLATALTAHSRPCIALRSRNDGENWCYSADSGPSDAVAALAAGCDLLIHEATVAVAEPHHSTPAQAGELAQRAAVRRLVLVHFSPQWTMSVAAACAAVRSAGFNGELSVGVDGEVIVTASEPGASVLPQMSG